MWKFKIVVILTSCAAFPGLPAGAADQLQELLALTSSSERLIAQSQIQFSQPSPVEVAGQLDCEFGFLQIEFSAVAAPAVSAQLVLHGQVLLEAESDLTLGTRVLRTDGHALSIEEKVGLQTLAAQLEHHLRPHARRLPAHEDLLFRVVSYWADAPVGFALRSRDFAGPGAARTAEREVFYSSDDRGLAGCDGSTPPESLSACASGCVDNEDGITYWPDACSCSVREICHDTHSFPFVCDHPWCCELVGAGCSLPGECQGRCGGGCGSDGAGAYTWDCADHDRCCRIHGGCFNPLSFACGDEYEEAADDFLFGESNCAGGCAVQPSGACCLSNFNCQILTAAQCQGQAGTWNGANTACASCPVRPRGDMNCDGVVSVADIGGFVLALTNPAGYAAAFPGCDVLLGDMNGDGTVSVGDIGAFVALLTGG